ncbi:MAG: sulfite exporter TauE/SafE family protein [Clostridia bacterium]|nr:sulfite exporter TauE/SafE family protein [Clostridia bacterium]
MRKFNWKAAIAGALAGLVNGLFGAGGGMVLVPLMERNKLLKPREIFASAIAVMLPISAVSFLIYYLRGSVDFTAALPYLLGGAAGGLLGGLLYRKIPTKLLHRALGLFILWGGIRCFL